MAKKKTNRDRPLPETNAKDFHPADYNKDGLISDSERKRYKNSQKNERKSNQSSAKTAKKKAKKKEKKKVNVIKTVGSLSAAAIAASEAYNKVRENLKKK